MVAYSPLTRGQRLNDPTLVSLAKKYDKTVPQILIRYGLQKVTKPFYEEMADRRGGLHSRSR